MPAVAATAPGGERRRRAPSEALDKLSKLADLHKAGVLTDEEFAAKKAQLLGSV